MSDTPRTDEADSLGDARRISCDLELELSTSSAEIERLRGQVKTLREALDGIEIYANDTLSGRVDGPDDRAWQREAVVVLRTRARAALEATR